MNEKIVNVFYNTDLLPYKDQERQVHFPIVGGAFLGASNTTKVRFYFDRIGNSNTTWVAVAKLPNGKQGSKVLSVSEDTTLGENYAELSLDNWFTQAKGDVYIALQGYQGGVQYSYNSETELYEITGTPTIQTTGSIKLAINYAPIGDSPDYTDEFTTYQEILAGLGDKADITSTIIVVNDISQQQASNYQDGQVFYNLADRKLYKLDNSSFVVFQPYVSISTEPIPQSDFAIILAHKEYPILYGSYVYWYYGEDTTALRYVRNDLDVSSNTFTTTKQQLTIFKNTREYDLFTQNAETYNKSKIDTELSGKADKSTTYTKTETDALLNAKQNTLVSGTNIKSLTVDGVEKSLLGSGTIEVGTGSGGGAWGTITGDIQDQTDLWNELQTNKEIAEGKTKTFVISYSRNAPTTDSQAQGLKKPDGTAFTDLADFNSYVDGYELINSNFNTQTDPLSILLLTVPDDFYNKYIIDSDGYVYLITSSEIPFNKGDNILITERLDSNGDILPDRWYGGSHRSGSSISIRFYALETQKVDLDNYATKTELAEKSDLTNIAPEYDSDTTYAVGDKSIHDGELYTCNTPISTPETWNSEHWTQVSIASGFVDLDKAQVISGVKTFRDLRVSASSSYDSSSWALYGWGNSGIDICQASNQSRGIKIDTNSVKPLSNNTFDLGTSTYKWKDLYLSGTAYVGGISLNETTFTLVKDGNSKCELGQPNNTIKFYDNNIRVNTALLRPQTNNATDLGASSNAWKDLYLSGTANTEQLHIGSSSSNWTFRDFNGYLRLKADVDRYHWGYYVFGPLVNNAIDLGGITSRWKDGYFSGQVYASNTFNVINASDITNNTLTQAQYDLITNGKPTLISGTYMNRDNQIWITTKKADNTLTILSMGSRNQYDQSYIQQVTVNASKVISFNDNESIFMNSSLGMYLSKVYQINGKNIPNYPSSTGTFVLKCVDGVLTWVAE